MRELTLSELELVSGGNNSSVTDIDEIVVIGNPGGGGGDWGDWGDWGDSGDYGDGGGGGGGDQGSTYDDIPECVTNSPAIADEKMFMDVVQHLTNEMRGWYNGVNGNPNIDSSKYEYGAMIYELNGQIGYGNITTNNSAGFVNISSAGVPDGARIVAYIHNHPDQGGIDDRVPSSDDWDHRRDLVNETNLPRGITIDPNLLIALYSNEDDKTRIYDKNDRNTNTPSCVAAN